MSLVCEKCKQFGMKAEEFPRLVYFKQRGQAHIIRMTLMEIGIHFEDVFITNRSKLPDNLASKYGLQIEKVPYLLHDGKAYYQTPAILKYCCSKFNTPNLLGADIKDKSSILEVINKYQKEKNRINNLIMKGVRTVLNTNNGQQGIQFIRTNIYQASLDSKLYQGLIKLFMKSGGYLFGYLTVADFIFYELSFQLTNICQLQEFNKSHLYLFRQFFESQEFFNRHKLKINSYPVIFTEGMAPHVAQILDKIWIDNLAVKIQDSPYEEIN